VERARGGRATLTTGPGAAHSGPLVHRHARPTPRRTTPQTWRGTASWNYP